jgi:hypothetical protein
MGLKPDVQINIDALVLPGFSRRDAERVRTALSLELQRLVLDNGLPQPDSGFKAGANFNLEIHPTTGHMRPEAVGVQAARALYAQMG